MLGAAEEHDTTNRKPSALAIRIAARHAPAAVYGLAQYAMNLLDQRNREVNETVCPDDTEEEYRHLPIGELEKRQERYEGLVRNHQAIGSFKPDKLKIQVARIQAEIARRPSEEVFKQRVAIKRSSSS